MKEVYNYIDSLLETCDTVVLGCSGGPDSMCLFSLLLKLRKTKDISIICAHVNHNVREESIFEKEWLAKFCSKNKVTFESMTIENYGDDNFENEARNIRYNYFESLIKKYDAKYLMTAHHGDDLVETILMKIVRGSNLSGYSGFKMEVFRDFYTIVRPLITVTKDEIIEYDEKHKIDYMIDKTNFLDIHTRNRYRKTVLPFLKSEDSLVHKKFLKYSKTLNMYDEYINKQLSRAVSDVYKDKKIIVDKFLKLDYLIQLKIVYLILEKFYDDDMILISDVHAELIIKLIKSSRANSCVYLPNNVKAVKDYNFVSIKRETEQIDKYEIEISDEEYKNLLAKTEGLVLSKTRYRVPVDNYLMEIDFFHNEYEGLSYMEIEFDNTEEADSYVVPSWAIKELTYDSRFTNAYLAKGLIKAEDFYL